MRKRKDERRLGRKVCRRIRRLSGYGRWSDTECGAGITMIPGSNWERTPEERKVCLALEKVAAQVGAKHINAGMFRSH